jgi:membrane protease YdiL (CAAX protease family)
MDWTMNYDLMFNNPLSTTCYSLLLVSILSLWIKQDFRIWGTITLVSVICGFLSARLDVVGIISILVLGLLFYVPFKFELNAPIRLLVSSLVIVLSVALATHSVPGFNNWKVVDSVIVGQSNQPYSVYLNLDKTVIGLFILGLGFPLIKGFREWLEVIKPSIIILIVGLIVLLSANAAIGYVRWDVKLPDIFVIWSLKNLFFTCVSEEAFFRGFLQRNLTEKLKQYKYGNLFSLITVSILFGVAHFGGGFKYVVLATIAGIIYGYAYQKTQRIEAGIICHFGVNTFRFIFLTYPGMV